MVGQLSLILTAIHIFLHMEPFHKNSLYKKGVIGALLMYLSKAFHCKEVELLSAKLNVYGFVRKFY